MTWDGDKRTFRSTVSIVLNWTVVLVLLCLLIYLSGAIGYLRTIDATAGRSSVCEVHGVQMKRVRVPVTYGLVARLHRPGGCPHIDSDYLGGCIVSPTSPRHAYIYACSVGRLAAPK